MSGSSSGSNRTGSVGWCGLGCLFLSAFVSCACRYSPRAGWERSVCVCVYVCVLFWGFSCSLCCFPSDCLVSVRYGYSWAIAKVLISSNGNMKGTTSQLFELANLLCVVSVYLGAVGSDFCSKYTGCHLISLSSRDAMLQAVMCWCSAPAWRL